MKHVTKEEAWQPVPGEISTQLDRSQHKFEFSKKWFIRRNQTTWSTFLPRKFDGTQPVNMIQIGVFEGMDLIWCLQNILRNPQSRVLAIDPWAATRKLDQNFMDEVYQRAKNNLKPYRRQVHLVRGYSEDVLAQLLTSKMVEGVRYLHPFDLIVVDGDHNAPAVAADLAYAIDLASPGAWIVCDDVRNNRSKKNHVQAGIDEWLEEFPDCVKRVWAHRFCDCFEVL